MIKSCMCVMPGVKYKNTQCETLYFTLQVTMLCRFSLVEMSTGISLILRSFLESMAARGIPAMIRLNHTSSTFLFIGYRNT